MRTMNVGLAFTLLLLGCGHETDWTPETGWRQIVMFHDISNSLAADQVQAGKKIIDDIIDHVPAGTDLVVIPICENTDRAPEQRWTVPAPPGVRREDASRVREARDAFKKRIADNEDAIRLRTKATRTRYASCISPALRRAETEMQAVNAPDGTDVIFVSDMIEQCRDSILGQPVQLLAGARFQEANALLQTDHRLLSLPLQMRVFVMRPTAISTAAWPPDHPPSNELRDFWQHLFNRCGLPAQRVRWDVNAPGYLNSIVATD
jgi:hypothetical protein